MDQSKLFFYAGLALLFAAVGTYVAADADTGTALKITALLLAAAGIALLVLRSR